MVTETGAQDPLTTMGMPHLAAQAAEAATGTAVQQVPEDRTITATRATAGAMTTRLRTLDQLKPGLETSLSPT